MSLLDEIRDDPGARCNAIGLSANAGLALLKFTVGTWAMSEALVADGFNSAGDIVATAIAFAGYRIARQPPDDNHHYGHGNADSVAGLVVGGILFATGVFITLEGSFALFSGGFEAPGHWAIAAALGTAVIKEALFHYTTRVGKEVGSPALLASARDHRADVFMALTVAAGVLGASFGLPWLDPLTACVIGVGIAVMAWDPIRTNFGVLMDEAPDGSREQVCAIAIRDEAVHDVGPVRVHPLGAELVVDLEIGLDGSLTLEEAREVAGRVERAISEAMPEVLDVRAHVHPRT